jgi:prenyltransferase beta subunit
MLRAAGRGAVQLAESRDALIAFIRRQQHPDGGFRGRSEDSDLYYAVFAIESLIALEAELPQEAIAQYLATFGSGEGLDLVHLACLARCWADLGEHWHSLGPGPGLPPHDRAGLLRRIEGHRSADGGFAQEPGADQGTVYGCFLAFGALQDVSSAGFSPYPPRSRYGLKAALQTGIIRCLSHLRAPDGGFANERGLPAGSTPATAAAITLLRHLRRPVEPALPEWLLARHDPSGGFRATPAAPIPDLLSTATALHALAGLGVPLDAVRQPCLDFVGGLWNAEGGFQGSGLDDSPDCEYTYYGLLAFGHLAGESAPDAPQKAADAPR